MKMHKISCKYRIPNCTPDTQIEVFAKSTKTDDVKEAIAHRLGFFDLTKIFVSYIRSHGQVI